MAAVEHGLRLFDHGAAIVVHSTTKYVASFVGIVPATNPRLVVLVTVDEPAASIWGAS